MVLNISDIPDIPDGWKYVVSSLVGGGIAILVTFLNNRYQLRKDSQQWERDKLWDGYQRCISNLNLLESLLTSLDVEYPGDYILLEKEKGQIFSLYSEIYPYLYWIIYNHPNSGSKEIKSLKEIIEEIIEEKTDKNIETIKILKDRDSKFLGEKVKEIGMWEIGKNNDFLIHPKELRNLKKELIQLMTNDPRFF